MKYLLIDSKVLHFRISHLEVVFEQFLAEVSGTMERLDEWSKVLVGCRFDPFALIAGSYSIDLYVRKAIILLVTSDSLSCMLQIRATSTITSTQDLRVYHVFSSHFLSMTIVGTGTCRRMVTNAS